MSSNQKMRKLVVLTWFFPVSLLVLFKRQSFKKTVDDIANTFSYSYSSDEPIPCSIIGVLLSVIIIIVATLLYMGFTGQAN